MQNSNFWFYIIIAIVLLHVVVGFGYLIYKLSPRKKEDKNKDLKNNE
jgi:uncharacterized protein YqhQ